MLPALSRVVVTATWLLLMAPASVAQGRREIPSGDGGNASSLALLDARTTLSGSALVRQGKVIRAIPGTPFSATVTVTDNMGIYVQRNAWSTLENAIVADARALLPGNNLPRYTCWSPPQFDFLLEVERAAPDCLEPAIDRSFLEGLGHMLGGFESKDRYEAIMALSLTGTIARTGSTDPPVIKFRVFPMYQSIGRSEKLPDVNFGDADLQVVQYVKQEIIASTTNKDLLLFLGNTGAYFYYSFKPEDDRNVHLIPLSGSCMERSYTESAPVAKYKAHILDPAFKPGRFDRLVLIDYMYSGKGLLQFTMLLSSLGFLHRKYVKDMNPYLINLAYPPDDVFPGIARAARYKTNIIEAQVKVLKEVVIGQDRATLHKFIEGNFGRILPSYPRSVWQYPLHEVPNADREVGESIVRQIMANRVGS